MTERNWAFLPVSSSTRLSFTLGASISTAPATVWTFRWKSNVYAKQDELSVPQVDAFALDFAVANDIDERTFRACYLQAKASEKIHADLAEGWAMRVRSTPTYFIDGVYVSWFADNIMEEFLRKTYLGGGGTPKPEA